MSENAPITPMPVPLVGASVDPALRGVVFVGGSFDPPHIAHVKLPTQVRDFIETKLGHGWQMVFVPAARSPGRKPGPHASNAQRLEMLKLAIAPLDRAAIWTDELDRASARPGPSYTIDTLKRARSWLDAHAGTHVQLAWVIGADQLLNFHLWREPLAIVQLARVPVMLRGSSPTRDQLLDQLRASGAWHDEQLAHWSRSIVPVDTIEVSSSLIRQLLAHGDNSSLTTMLDPKVREYIRANRLYAHTCE
jgi:nicotinate-nucleotide adenylyltransferase